MKKNRKKISNSKPICRARGSKKVRARKYFEKLLFVTFVLAIIGMYAYDFFYTEPSLEALPFLSISYQLATFEPHQNTQIHTNYNQIYLSMSNKVYFFDINQSMEVIWSGIHNLERPILTGNGSYFALWQTGYPYVYFFGQAGLLFEEYLEILNVAVSDKGYMAVMHRKDSYRIDIFDKYGQSIFYTNFIDPQLVPMSIAINESHLAVSLMYIGGLNIASSVVIFSFESGLVASTEQEPGIIYSMQIDNNQLIKVGTNGRTILYLGNNQLDYQYFFDTAEDYFENYFIVRNNRQFIAYKRCDIDIPVWGFLSIPEPVSLTFLDRYDRLLLKTPHSLYIIGNVAKPHEV